MSDEQVVGKIVVNITRRYFTIYRCDGEGKIEEWDRFTYPARLKPAEIRSETRDLWGVCYDYANDTINGFDELQEGGSGSGQSS